MDRVLGTVCSKKYFASALERFERINFAPPRPSSVKNSFNFFALKTYLSSNHKYNTRSEGFRLAQ